jgi:trimethylamine:corrinoid methyltransferase-like protein
VAERKNKKIQHTSFKAWIASKKPAIYDNEDAGYLNQPEYSSEATAVISCTSWRESGLGNCYESICCRNKLVGMGCQADAGNQEVRSLKLL